VLLGAVEKPEDRSFDLWLLECNSRGDTLKTKVFGFPGNDIPLRIVANGENGLLIVLMNSSEDTGLMARLVALDAAFTELWSTVTKQQSALLRTDVTVDQSGQIWWLNTFASEGEKPVVSLCELDSEGNKTAEFEIETNNAAEGYSIRTLQDGTLGISCQVQPENEKATVQVIRVDTDGIVASWRDYADQLRYVAARLKTLIGVQWLTGFSLMVLPFYVVYARQELGAPPGAVGWFMLAEILGGVLGNLLWAALVDQYGSRRMLALCATTSTVTPLLAILLGRIGWPGLLPVMFLGGATFYGRQVGFQSALLEVAPAAERPTYSALNVVLILPVALLSLIAGFLLERWSYPTLFLIAAGFICVGALITRRLPERSLQVMETNGA